MKVDELKEWRLKYAGMAMQGILSNVDMLHSAIEASVKMNMSLQTVIARNTLSFADELIKELAGDNIELSPVRTEDSLLHSADMALTPVKSLSSQSNWKPSDKQLYGLSYAINHFRCDGLSTEDLEELLEQLKEL